MQASWHEQDHGTCDSNFGTAQRAPPAARALVMGEANHVQRWASGRLLEAGFEVHIANDGFDAVDAAHRDPPDVVVVDRDVPGVDARYVLHQLRRDPRTTDIPILCLTPSVTSALENVCRKLRVSLLSTGLCKPRARLRVHLPKAARRRVAVVADPGEQSHERRL